MSKWLRGWLPGSNQSQQLDLEKMIMSCPILLNADHCHVADGATEQSLGVLK
jgi:hypothetical protein